MAENFPMSLRQLLPILDIVGTANKHLARAGKFLQKYGNMDLFPVKMQVRNCAASPHQILKFMMELCLAF